MVGSRFFLLRDGVSLSSVHVAGHMLHTGSCCHAAVGCMQSSLVACSLGVQPLQFHDSEVFNQKFLPGRALQHTAAIVEGSYGAGCLGCTSHQPVALFHVSPNDPAVSLCVSVMGTGYSGSFGCIE